MKQETSLLAFILMNVLFFMFGIITTTNPILQIVIFGTTDWSTLFDINNLLSTAGLILSGVAVLGIVFKNDRMLLSGLVGFFVGYMVDLYPIVYKYPDPVGHMVYGILAFIYIFTAFQWWLGRDS